MSIFPRVYRDRAAAGVALAKQVRQRALKPPLVVLGLPRGGVAVAFEVAQALKAPLDVLLVRKVGMPGQPELAIGAIASGNIVVHEPRSERDMPDLGEDFARVASRERLELERRELAYRPGMPPLDLRAKAVILVDDGLATGSTMLAAVRAARQAGARSVIAAAPVASRQAADLVGAEVDGLVILQVPAELLAIGEWYEQFEQLEDAEVIRLLELNRKQRRLKRVSSQSA